MEKISNFVLLAVTSAIGTAIGSLIVENRNNIMEYVADPEVKGGYFVGAAIMIGLYIVLFVFWYLVIRPKNKEQDKKINKLILWNEFLTECIEMKINPRNTDDVVKDILLRVAIRKDITFDEAYEMIKDFVKM